MRFPNSWLSPVKGALLLGLVALSLGARAAPLDEAQQLIKAGQHGKALEVIERQLKSQPKDVQARFLKGVALMGLNRADEAEAVFKKLTEDQPNLPEPYNNLAVIYAQQKQYDKAREALEAAIRTHPAYATAHENLGDIYARLASQAYGKALQLDSANTTAQAKLALINEMISGKTGTPTVASTRPAPEKSQPKTESTAAVVAPQPAAKPASTGSETKTAGTDKPREATAQPASSANVEEEITAFVDAWLAAWSKKDVKAYLSYYSPDFATPGGMPRKTWEAERAQRINKPGPIKISREKLTVTLDAPDKATVRFRQHYQSANFKASSNKTLSLAKRNGSWQILKETAG